MKGELRNSITGLQLLAEGEGSFMDLLRQSVSSMSHWPEGAIVFTTAGEPREVSQSLAGNLLLLFQEAVGNAFKHGDARHVSVHVSFTKQNLAMKIRDDGRGFVPGEAPSTVAGHFGIAGMKRRMQWLGGSLQVRSKPGEGAEITITLPWKT
jgi:two-component system sensor histidine kinase DegS